VRRKPGVAVRVTTIDSVMLGVAIFAALYWLAALGCVVTFARRRPRASRDMPAVTVLKPLKGDDGHLYDNLRTFCEQDYPSFQIVFGVRHRQDPAAAVVERLGRELRHVDLTLVVNEAVVGANQKVSNLANLVRHAKHDTLIVADSDMRVDPGYIRSVIAPLEDSTVGLVTCLYCGVPAAGLASRLSAMFINEWFLPAALVGTRVEPLRHAFGATMACRRDTLRSIGGFEALADQLADDYMLGWLVSGSGLRVVLAPYVVQNIVSERNLRTLYFHELRWTRTFRTVRPLSYCFALLTHGVPLSLLWLAAGSGGGRALGATAMLVGLRCIGRLILYRALGRRVPWSETWLVPIRDIASFVLGIVSFLGDSVRWNEERFRVRRDGRLERQTRTGDGHPDRSAEPASLGRQWEEHV
jgi:ceramide glucosyltransferase